MASNYGKNVKTAKLNIEKPLTAGKPQYEVDTNGINEIIDKLGDIEDSDLQYSGYSTLGELYDSKDFSDLSIIGDVANRLDKYQLPEFYKMVKEKYGYDGVVSKDETIVFSNDQIIPTETIANNATTQNVQNVQPQPTMTQQATKPLPDRPGDMLRKRVITTTDNRTGVITKARTDYNGNITNSNLSKGMVEVRFDDGKTETWNKNYLREVVEPTAQAQPPSGEHIDDLPSPKV